MTFRSTILACLACTATLLSSCGGGLQSGVDAGQLDATGDAQEPTGPWSVFAKLGPSSLRKIWGTGDDDIWADGLFYASIDGPINESTLGPVTVPRIVHYDGTGWRDAAVPGTANPWGDIWGFGRDDVWVVGDSVRHFDGVVWREVASPVGVTSVWGAAPNDVWFGLNDGTQMILHWNGSAITAMDTPAVDGILSIWGFSASDVWAGGGSGSLIHWDGSTWSRVGSGTTLYLYALWGAAPDDLWGVGNGGNRVHWDGAQTAASHEDYTSFYAVTGTSGADVWGVGECCWQTKYQAWVSHYDGVAWTDSTIPGFSQVSGVWVSPSGVYYAISGDTVLRTASPGDGSAPPAAGSASACTAESAALTAQLQTVVDDLRRDGGPCATVADCSVFVPSVACGANYRLTGCSAVVADPAAARARAALECDPRLLDPACHAQIFVDCPGPIAACQAGRCTSTTPQP